MEFVLSFIYIILKCSKVLFVKLFYLKLFCRSESLRFCSIIFRMGNWVVEFNDLEKKLFF